MRWGVCATRLGDSACGLPGARAITRTLSVNTTLTLLDLSNSLRIAPIGTCARVHRRVLGLGSPPLEVAGEPRIAHGPRSLCVCVWLRVG